MNKDYSSLGLAANEAPMAYDVRFVAVPGGGMEHVFSPPRSAPLPTTVDPSVEQNSHVCGSGAAFGLGAGAKTLSSVRERSCTPGSVPEFRARTTSTQAPDLKLGDWATVRRRRAQTTSAVPGCRAKRLAKPSRAKSPPPAWEPETFQDGPASGDAEGAPSWNQEDEQALRTRIREAMDKIEGISGDLAQSRTRADRTGDDGGGARPRSRRGGAATDTGGRTAGAPMRTSGHGARSPQEDGSIEGLHGSLKVSLELATTGEKHASANTTAIADMSEWLTSLEQRQLINIRQDEAIEGTPMAGVILAEGLAVGDTMREYSDITSAAYKKLASIFKRASTENERALKELSVRLVDSAAETEEEAGNKGKTAAINVQTVDSTRKTKEVERMKRLQEKQLQEAAKHNEEAQVVINQLKTSLHQLELRFKQARVADSMSTSLSTNRQRDTVRWKALALEYEMKIRYLERALAQEESKLRIAEQVHREEGLELHLEMATRQRGEARADGKTSGLQEEITLLTSKLSETNARLTIAENVRLKLEQELNADKEKYRKLKGQLAAQSKESAEALEEELRSLVAQHANAMSQAKAAHEKDLVTAREELAALRDTADEEAGRREYEVKLLKEDLAMAKQKAQSGRGNTTSQERLANAESEIERLSADVEQARADAEAREQDKQDLQQELSETRRQLKSLRTEGNEGQERMQELDAEVKRLEERCRDLVTKSEITAEERARIERVMREQHRLADEARAAETAERLTAAEAERGTLLSRLTEAEAEVERYRRAAKDLAIVLDEAKSTQAAAAAAAAADKAESAAATARGSAAGRRRDSAAEREAMARTSTLQNELSEANKRVEGLERELAEAERAAKEAEDAKDRAHRELEQTARAEAEAREAAEAAAAAAAAGPSELQQESFKARAIVKVAVRELELRLHVTENEVQRLQNGWEEAEEKAKMLEVELETARADRDSMREEVQDADCQIQRMAVERSSLLRRNAENTEILARIEILLRELGGCLDTNTHRATHDKVVATLSELRKRNADERTEKLSRARERIDAENRQRAERVLNAMNVSRNNTANKLKRASAHLRPLLAIFLRPGVIKALIGYSKKVESGEEPRPVATASADAIDSGAPPFYSDSAPVVTLARPLAARRRAASMNDGGMRAAGNATPAETPDDRLSLSREAEARRHAAFGDGPGIAGVAGAAGVGTSVAQTRAFHRVGSTSGRGQARSGSAWKLSNDRRAGRLGRDPRAISWRTHGEPTGMNLTLTTDTAAGRLPVAGLSEGELSEAELSACENGKEFGDTAAGQISATPYTERLCELENRALSLKSEEDDLRTRKQKEEVIRNDLRDRLEVLEAARLEPERSGEDRARLDDNLRETQSRLAEANETIHAICRQSKHTAESRLASQSEYARVVEKAAAVSFERSLTAPGFMGRGADTPDHGKDLRPPAAFEGVGVSMRPKNVTSEHMHDARLETGLTPAPERSASAESLPRQQTCPVGDSDTPWTHSSDSAGKHEAGVYVHPVFAKREKTARELHPGMSQRVIDVAHEAATLEEKIAACKGDMPPRSGSGLDKSRDCDEDVITGVQDSPQEQELAALVDSKASAAKELSDLPLNSIVVALETLLEERLKLGRDERDKIEANEITRRQLKRSLASADLVEVSIALGESMVLQSEGAKLTRRQLSTKRDSAAPSVLSREERSATAEEGQGGAGGEGRCAWDASKDAENRTRIGLLAESLESSEVHDLQVLRRSLERQVREASCARGHDGRPSGGLGPNDGEARWRNDVLEQRLAAVSRAVEKKGGWRAAVFDDGCHVNVEVDVAPWPAEEAVLILSTVKDSLVVQLMEARAEVEALEEAVRASGGEALVDHLDAAADLHRAVAQLWEGVGALSCRPFADRFFREQSRGQDFSALSTPSFPEVASAEEQVSHLMNSQQGLDIPMHLEDLPIDIVTRALSSDTDRIKTAATYLVPAVLAAAAAVKTAAETPRQAPEPAAKPTVHAETRSIQPPEETPASALVPVTVQVEAVAYAPVETIRSDVPLEGDAQVIESRPPTAFSAVSEGPAASSERRSSFILQQPEDTASSASASEGEDCPDEEAAHSIAQNMTNGSAVGDAQKVERSSEPYSQVRQRRLSADRGAITQADFDEAQERTRKLEETARELKAAVDERGELIDLLGRELEDTKAALADSEARHLMRAEEGTSEANELASALEQAELALGQERDILAKTARTLDASTRDRERLQAEVAESKVKESELESMLREISERERCMLQQMEELRHMKVAEQALVVGLDQQMSDPDISGPALEHLRVERRKKAKSVADTNGRLKSVEKQHENMWERAMKAYKWVHHLPQISVKNRLYRSVEDWIQAELADQRVAREKLERIASSRGKASRAQRLLPSHRFQTSVSTSDLLTPVTITSLSGSSGLSRPKSAAAEFGRGSYGLHHENIRQPGVSKNIGALDGQRGLAIANMLHGKRWNEADQRRLSPHLPGVASCSRYQMSRLSTGPEHWVPHRYGTGPFKQDHMPTYSQAPLTVNIPSPAAEPPSPSRTPRQGIARGLANSKNDEERARAIARVDDGDRHKSLFTNAPAELPGVTVISARGNGSAFSGREISNPDDSPGTRLAARDAPRTTSAADDAVGSGARRAPNPRQRAQTATMDYHNTLRRKSSNTSFTQPVGDPSSLAKLVRSRSDALDVWGDDKGINLSRATDRNGTRAVATTPAAPKGTVAVPATPQQYLASAATRRVSAIDLSAPENVSKARPSSSAVAPTTTAGIKARSDVHQRAMAKDHRSGGPKTSRTEWVGAVYELASQGSISDSPGLPRQLTVPGGLDVKQLDGGFRKSDAPRNRPQQARKGHGGEYSSAKPRAGNGAPNNMHPAWRPKGLSRRQRAISIVERG